MTGSSLQDRDDRNVWAQPLDEGRSCMLRLCRFCCPGALLEVLYAINHLGYAGYAGYPYHAGVLGYPYAGLPLVAAAAPAAAE